NLPVEKFILDSINEGTICAIDCNVDCNLKFDILKNEVGYSKEKKNLEKFKKTLKVRIETNNFKYGEDEINIDWKISDLDDFL
ncbi:hypothetical protein HK099_003263, partial [Clydaea vesicula]